MNRRGRASQVVDLIDLQQNRLHNIMSNELEPRVLEMMDDVLLPPREEVIDHDHVVTSGDELVHEMAPHEPRPARHDDPQPPPRDRGRDAAVPVDEPGDDGGGPISPRQAGGGLECPGDQGAGLRGGEAGERGLEDEEGRADEDADEDEEEALLPEEVVDGSGEGSGVLQGLGGVRGRLGGGDLLVAAAGVDARLLVQLLHGGRIAPTLGEGGRRDSGRRGELRRERRTCGWVCRGSLLGENVRVLIEFVSTKKTKQAKLSCLG